jgi:uncharacterized membrane protein YjgN (DUF898 family)
MNIKYSGTLKNHFLIGFKNIALTILTLGLYRFWGKTNLRSYIWSHLEVYNHPFIYHGTPFELLRAFLKALPLFIALLAVQHGLELILLFLGAGVTFIAIIWIVEYAHYSKHQYIYSRTTWQGIRFSLKGSRVEYANLAFKLFFKSLLTLGLKDHLYTIEKNQFVCNNISWGDIPLTFTGNAQDLKKMNYKTWLLIIPTFFLSRIYFSVYCARYVMSHQAFQDVKLQVNYTFMQFLRFHLANVLLTILTVGLASPYVTYRQLKFIQKYYHLEGNAEDLLTQQNTDETHGQDGASGLLDLSDF